MSTRGEREDPRLDLPLQPVTPLQPELEPPFLRPKHRTRIARRPRRGLGGRLLLGVQLVTLLLVGVGGLWLGYAKVMASERLKVARVSVKGNHFLSEGEVRELLGPAVGENILNLDIAALKARLRASPWVSGATVRRTLPDQVEVEIGERVPLALAEADGLYLMDAEGTLIEVYGPRTAGFDLPIVRGLKGVVGDARRDRAQRAGALLDDLEELAAEVSEVEVQPSGELRVVLRGKGEVLRVGTAPPFKKKLQTFLGLREELAQKAPQAEYFDLRFRDRIYARQPPAAAATATSAGS